MKKLQSNKIIIVKLILALTVLLVLGISFIFADSIEKAFNLKVGYAEFERSEQEVKSSDYFVSYVDVGQGNCTVAKLPDGKTMIIDGGNTMYGDTVVKYLKANNIDKIDYMIATHADADHIGGLAAVLESFDVLNIYRPFQISGKGDSYDDFIVNNCEDLNDVYDYYKNLIGKNNRISRVTSNTYKNFINAVYSEKYKVNGETLLSNVYTFYDGLVIGGENYSIEFYAPLLRTGDEALEFPNAALGVNCRTKGKATASYSASDSNGNSAILTLSVKSKTFLFTGDAPYTESGNKTSEKFEELDFIKNLTEAEKLKLKNVSVYLVGHHGSQYSTSKQLLDIISPEYAVISVGKNSYGHPTKEALDRLIASENLTEDKILMTIDFGDITFTDNGKNLIYSLSVTSSNESFSISWYLLGSIIAVVLIIIIFSVKIKIKKPKKAKR